jgi:hypothetical protein
MKLRWGTVGDNDYVGILPVKKKIQEKILLKIPNMSCADMCQILHRHNLSMNPFKAKGRLQEIKKYQVP